MLDADELRARLTLTVATEPGDPMTGALLRLVGPVETVRLAAWAGPFPARIDPMAGALWRVRTAERLVPDQADKVRERSDRLGLRILVPDGAGWPDGAAGLGDAVPLLLWVRGDPGLLTTSLSSRVTIVGARAATGYGEHVATELAAGLAGGGRVVVSGGGYGIDAAAHRAALTVGAGRTMAVLACGLDRYYPAGHANLFDRIAATGVLVSELPPGAAPTRSWFQARGRLLAALSGATIVVEAGARSGALRVAAHAHGLDRPVGAVPGPVTSAVSAGCHLLLRKRTAAVICGVEDAAALVDPPATRTMLDTPFTRTAAPAPSRGAGPSL